MSAIYTLKKELPIITSSLPLTAVSCGFDSIEARVLFLEPEVDILFGYNYEFKVKLAN